ncbi:MAG: SDR family oxidoreductase [Nitriliruptoraceae bacterium]|nr:SDR family oxidoreductase [Nitriliruptoraceae bacterium]
MTTASPASPARPAPSRWQRELRAHYGPWAVVTGASDGIGRSTATLLAEAGIHVVLVARRGAVLDALADELHVAHDVGTRVVAADLTSPSGVDAVLDATRGLDVGLFVAAAGFGSTGHFVDRDLADELAMIDVNCRAVVALSHGFARRLEARGAGGIVLFGSVVGFQGVPRTATYAATKAFVQSFAEGLRLELKPAGVQVLATAPGPTRSGFAEQASMTMSSAADAQVVARATLRSLGGRRSTVRPGGLAKLLGFSLILLPRWARVRLMGTIMSGMTDERSRPATSGADR